MLLRSSYLCFAAEETETKKIARQIQVFNPQPMIFLKGKE
jgi:hypothetical protein